MRKVNIPLSSAVCVLGFVASLLNVWLLIFSTVAVSLVLIGTKKVQGAIVSLLFIQLRSILNPGIFALYTGLASMVKWGLVFLISIYIIANCLYSYRSKRTNIALLRIILFCVTAIISSLIYSSYPLVAVFKVLSFVIPTMAVMIGVVYENKVDWMPIIIKPLGILLFLSILLYGTSVGFYRNGRGFQGLFAHPNVYGVMLAFFVAGYLHKEKNLQMKQWVVIAAAFGLCIVSQSRTGILSIVLVVLISVLSLDLRRGTRTAIILLILLASILLILSTGMSDYISKILFKGHEASLLYSRENQIERNIDRFLTNPLFGRGFSVPYYSWIRDWHFSFDIVVENGNIVLALLGDVGIVGMLLFLSAYVKVYMAGEGVPKMIFFTPFVVSMGEMSFFSTNNFGILIYFFLAIYIAESEKVARLGSIGANNLEAVE